MSDIYICFEGQYIYDYHIVANFCRHYIISENRVTNVLTQYENLSLDDLKSIYDRLHKSTKIGDYYFNDYYNFYSTIYLSKNNLATVDYRNSKDIARLPINIQKEYRLRQDQERRRIKQEINADRLNEIRQKDSLNKLEVDKAKFEKDQILKKKEAKSKAKEIFSKTYDLQKYDSIQYAITVGEIRKKIIETINSTNKIPNNKNLLAETYSNKYRFNNTYNVLYKLEDNRDYNSDNDFTDVRLTKKFSLISGNDSGCWLLNQTSIELPMLKMNNADYLTEVHFDNMKLDYAIGTTYVKVKNKEIDFLKFIPDSDIQAKIIEENKNITNGKYIITYQYFNILGEVNTIYDIKPR